jgi:hypothetical protein
MASTLDNAGYTAAASYLSITVPDGFVLQSADMYRPDGLTKFNYAASEIYKTNNTYSIAVGELISEHPRKVDWNVSVSSDTPDGDYSFEIRAGSGNAGSPLPAVTRVRIDTDDDDDGMPDAWEITHGLDPLTDDSALDPDGDGHTNLKEYQAGSDPRDPDSRPVQVTLHLFPGFNLIGIPVNPSGMTGAFDLLPVLGNAAEIDRILRLDGGTGRIQEARYDTDGNPTGEDFPVVTGEGLILYSLVAKDVSFNGIVNCPGPGLAGGVNLSGFPCAPGGLTAYQLLQTIGDETVVDGIQRYHPDTGTFETAGYDGNHLVGIDFPIMIGEGYFITME